MAVEKGRTLEVGVSRIPLLAVLSLVARTAGAQAPPVDAPRSVVALRVDGSAPRLDGRLDDAAWASAQPAGDFVLREPTEGAPAPERTAVRFVYTRDALYVGARMYSDTPAAVRALVARRDREIPSEQLVVSLDTRADHRTAYSFAVTPGGVRTDYYHSSDFEDDRDYSYDPVWEVKTAVDSLGWTAELRIPFTQLRFNPGREHVWGVNLVRHVPARNEQGY
ncbi:MAG: carbohydrate binding family 9 domain-containing protein, partial [Acidimicrobiales bacterium]